MIETAYLLGIAASLLIANAVALRLAGRFAFGQQPGRLAAALAVVVMGLAIAVAGWLVPWIGGLLNLPWLLAIVAVAVISMVACFASLAAILRLSQIQALKGMLVLSVSSLCVLGFAALLLPAFVKGYSMPTNGMAPTIRGRHFVGTCPDCGGEAIVSVDENWETGRPEPSDRAICSKCFRSGVCAEVNPELQIGDRLMVRSRAQPRRWDIVVFQFPEDRRQIYAQRLIGLPGETIEIKSGEIWIDGAKHDPPPDVDWLNYELPGDAGLLRDFACREPLHLKSDECFTLGDNSLASYDSRFWGPLPVANLRGVVWSVYFPPRAWRSFPRH